MIGILEPHVKSIVRLINLVAFDVAEESAVTITDDANPTTKYIYIPIKDTIHKDLHKHLRALLKKSLWTDGTACGKVVISPRYLKITVYLKRLRDPAWKPQS